MARERSPQRSYQRRARLHHIALGRQRKARGFEKEEQIVQLNAERDFIKYFV